MNTRYENSTGSDGVELLPVVRGATPPEPPRRHRPERRQSGAWSTSVRFGLGMLLLCGLAYPAVSVLISSNAFPQQAGGSLIRLGDKQVGSALVAQPFSSGKYLQPRPSTSGYDPMAMAGSNLAPSNPELRKQVALRVAAVAKREGVPPSDVPVDLVFASGSSIDPDISPAAALLQVARIASTRQLPPTTIRRIVTSHIKPQTFGILGQARVNVLETNLALDALEQY